MLRSAMGRHVGGRGWYGVLLGVALLIAQPAAAECAADASASPVVDEFFTRPETFDWQGDFVQDDDVCFASRQSGAQLRAYLVAPANVETSPEALPVVIVAPGSGTGQALYYLWAARALAGHGYLAVAVDPQGSGRSESAGEAEQCGASGCPGVPWQQADNYIDAVLSALDFVAARGHPWLANADLTRIGAAGHSLSARAISYLQGVESALGAIVAWDNLASDLQGDAGSSSGGGECGAAIGGELPEARPATPRVPAMGQASDAVAGCEPQNNDAQIKKTAYELWRAGEVPSMQLVFAGAAHADWAQSRSSDPAQLETFAHFTRAWFDLFLSGDESARDRLLARPILGREASAVFSGTFQSAAFLPDARVHCPDLAPGICEPIARLSVRLSDGEALPASIRTGTSVVLDASESASLYSSDPIAEYRFDFGDGTPIVAQAEPSVSHSYATSGIYVPGVTVADAQGLSSTVAAAAVTVDEPALRVNLAADPAAGDLAAGPVAVTFTAVAADDDPQAGALSYTFYFGDGTHSARRLQSTASHEYSAAGVYPAYVVVADGNGNSATSAELPITVSTTLTVVPDVPVVARLRLNLDGSVAPVTVTLDASESTAPDGAIYRFSFGDGEPDITGTEAVVRHVYTTPGTFTATVSISDDASPPNTSSASATITVTAAQATVAQLVVSPTSVRVAEPVSFDASRSIAANGATIAGYRFDFGDGASVLRTVAELGDAAGRITHAYPVPGVYQPSVTVTDSDAASSQAKARVSVAAVSAPDATGQPGGGGAVGVMLLLFAGAAALARRVVGVVLAVAGVGLSACGGTSSPDTASLPPLGDLIAKEIRDVTIASPAPETLSGAPTTAVPATVFIPEHRQGERYPLILHSHGWGGSRVDKEKDDTYPTGTPLGYFLRIDAQIPKFVAAGYAVISFDERGWGDSSSEAMSMHPDLETRDAIAVLDWAEKNLELARDARGDPLIGTIGGSYGGGFQHNLAMLDPRVDAMIPGATWASFHAALAPNDVIKKSWNGILCLAGNLATLGPELQAACQAGYYELFNRFTEEEPPEVIQFFIDNSWITCRQDGFRGHACRQTPVDVLLVQGQRDVLFNLNEAADAYDFYRTLGGDVRLWTMQGGHINPGLQAPDGPVSCGQWDIFDVYRRWFDAKLKGIGSLDDLPAICLSLDDATGAVLDALPRGGEATVTIPANAPVTVLPGVPVFVPMDGGAVEGEGWALAGIPTIADLTVGGGVAFIGVAVRRAGGLLDPLTPVDDQVLPFRPGRLPAAGLRLAGVGEKLMPGDIPGILMLADHPQYEPAGPLPVGPNFATNSAAVSGVFRLPLIRAERSSR